MHKHEDFVTIDGIQYRTAPQPWYRGWVRCAYWDKKRWFFGVLWRWTRDEWPHPSVHVYLGPLAIYWVRRLA